MQVSYRWLARHVDLSGISVEELAEDLTLSTAEVEGIEPFAPQLSNVVVGHVTKRDPHPTQQHKKESGSTSSTGTLVPC